MNRQNEKGQTLVSFALILPILVMLFALVIDTGYTYLEEKQLRDGVLIGLKYGMKHHEEDVKDQVRELIVENVDNISILNIYMLLENTKEKHLLCYIQAQYFHLEIH